MPLNRGNIVKWMFKTLLILLLWPLTLLAQDQSSTNVSSAGQKGWNELNGEKLEALKLNGDATRGEESFQVCQGCHKRGATGSASGAYPRLAGQHVSVLIEQIADIRSGKRKNDKMLPFADEHELTTQAIADIAAYLHALPLTPNVFGKGPGNALARGKTLYLRDCLICHGENGEGSAEKFYPLIAGQNYKYMLREVGFIRDGKRGNANPEMIKVIKPYSDADLAAVTDYISELEIH